MCRGDGVGARPDNRWHSSRSDENPVGLFHGDRVVIHRVLCMVCTAWWLLRMSSECIELFCGCVYSGGCVCRVALVVAVCGERCANGAGFSWPHEP